MIVINHQRVTAIVIRHDGRQVSFVPMRSGKLSAQRLSAAKFAADWWEADYPLERALDAFIQHAEAQGASQEAMLGLQRLRQREQAVVARLF